MLIYEPDLELFTSVGMLASAGDIYTLKQLLSTFAITPKFIRHKDNLALELALESDKFECAEWLVNTFGLNSVDIQSGDNKIILHAISTGNIRSLEWIFDRFVEIKKPKMSFVCHACAANQIGVAKWFLAKRAYLPFNTEELGHIMRNCDFDTAKWVVSTFNVTKEHFVADNSLVLTCLFLNDDINTMIWGVYRFPITKAELVVAVKNAKARGMPKDRLVYFYSKLTCSLA